MNKLTEIENEMLETLKKIKNWKEFNELESLCHYFGGLGKATKILTGKCYYWSVNDEFYTLYYIDNIESIVLAKI